MSDLKSTLEGLEKSLLLQAMKTLLYILPIFLLAEKVYCHYSGGHMPNLTEFNLFVFISGINRHAALCSFVFFALTYVFCYYMETMILPPLIVSFFERKFSQKEIGKALDIIEDKQVKSVGHNPLKYIHLIPRTTIVEGVLSVIMTFSLWMVYVNNIASYLCIALVVYLSFFLLKLINTFYEVYPVENLKDLDLDNL